MHIYGENIMKNLSFLTLFAFLSVSFVVADEPVDEDVEVVAEATMTESEDAAEDEDAQDLGRVSVTGSRIKRVDIEGATPLITITRADIDNAGFQTVYDAVSNLTQNTGSVNGENFQAGFNASLQPINLRDFGPGRTLVLVNGKRTADYPFPYNGESASFNWGAIPLAAVERIEVLTSGASSIYGSDAVAGVVNVILVDGLEKQTARVVAGAGVNQGSGGETLNLEFAGGGFGERYSYTYALEYYDEQQVPISSRSEHDSYLDANDGGLPSRGLLMRDTYSFFNPSLPGFGFNHYTPDQLIRGIDAVENPGLGTTATAGLDCSNAGNYFRPTEEQIGNYVWFANGDWCAIDTSANGSLTNERTRTAAYVSGTYELTDSVEAYAKVVLLETDTIGVLDNLFTPFEWVSGPQPYGSVDSVWIRNVDNDGFYTPGYSAMMDVRFQKIFPGVYRGSSYEEETQTVDFGLRGVLNNGFEWDMSYTENTYDVVQTGRNFLREALFDKIHNIGGVDGFGNPCVRDQAVLLDGDPSNGEVVDWYGIYGYGAAFNQANCYDWDWYLSEQTVDEVEALRVDNVEPADAFSEFFVASITGDIMQLPYGPLAFAAVVEQQTKGYEVNLSQLNKDGLLWGIGGVDGGGERDRTAVGIELNIPATENLLLSVSTRWDEYDDAVVNVDRQTAGATLEWRPKDNVLVRASWSESFKAPDLPYSFVGERRFFTQQTDYWSCYVDGQFGENGIGCGGGYGIINIDGITTGNLGLKEEEGDSYAVGVVWEPMDRMVVTVDAFHIQLGDIVATKSLSQMVLDEAVCRAREAGAVLDSFVDYPASYCTQVKNNIIRGGKDFSAPEGSITAIYETPVNIAGQEFLGIDTSVAYAWVTDKAGDFSVSVFSSHQIDLKYAEDVGDPLLSYMNNSYTPRSRQSARFGWNRGDWGAGVSVLRVGHMEALDGNKLSPYFNTNFTVNYDLTQDSFLAFTVTNVFDAIPDSDDAYDTGSSFYPYGFNSFRYPRFGPEAYLVYQMRF